MTADDLALEHLFKQEYSRLVHTVSVILGDSDAAADVVQDTFVQASRHWGSVATYDEPGQWLRRVAVNRALDERRWRRRRTAALPRLARAAASAERESALDFDAALAGLPPGQRAVIAMFYVADRISFAAWTLSRSAVSAGSPGASDSAYDGGLNRGALPCGPVSGSALGNCHTVWTIWA